MRRIVLSVILAVVNFGSPLFAEDTDKEKVSHRIQEFTDALNKANGDAVSSMLTQDASFTTPFTGEQLTGKNEVTQFFEKEFPLLKGKKIIFIEKTVDIPTAETATVQGVSVLTDKGVIIRQLARKIELVKQNDSWYINSIKEIEVQIAPELYSHLKELEWLVGNWQDTDEHVAILYATQWDKFKNVLIQHFRINVYGIEMMEGTQIIGWDPIEKKIRSWVYDSDGGFGTGLWSKKGDSWYATLNFVLSDGQKGVLTNVYTPRDNKSYIFSSIDRKVGDQKLPNIEPVTMVKEG